MLPKASLKFAIAAAVAGVVAGYAKHRAHPRARTLASLHGLEWFLSAGGASVVASVLRNALEAAEMEVTERTTTVEELVVERGE